MKRTTLALIAALVLAVSAGAQNYHALYNDLPIALEKPAAPSIPDLTVSICSYGASGDGVTLCTEAFDRAIKDISKRGGGHIIIPSGIWLTGPIKLRSGIDLHLETGAIIQFTPDKHAYFDGDTQGRARPCISADKFTYISITGDGIIDGKEAFVLYDTIGNVLEQGREWLIASAPEAYVATFGEGATLSGWSTYSGVNWKSATASSVKPFGKFGYHFMSGDDDAADETGGHSAWDPMWARGVNDSELFLYGTHYGAAWWSNMLYLKTTVGCSIGHNHFAVASAGPIFAAEQDGLGGGDSSYKGFLSQVRYEFPLVSADKAKGERLEIYGHVLAEFFNPGDYYSTDKPSWFVRWQLDFRF